MKKIWMILVALVACTMAWADPNEAVINNLRYSLNYTNSTATVLKETNHYVSYVKIPEYITYKGHTYHVIGIGYEAFRGTYLRQISLPQSIQSIGVGAFQNSDLKDITLPVNLTSIGNYAFANTKITSIVVPDNVKSIGYAAFENCHYLKKVIIPGKEISFGKSTFYGCNLTVYATYNIEIPGVPKTWFAKMSLDQLLHYAPFSVYAKEYVEQHINEWQKRGEFEKTNDWLQRVNDSSRQHKINTLVAEAEQQYLDYWTSRKSLNLQLGRYDADNEVFAITDDNYGTAYIAVPFNEAQAFKSNWNKKKITNRIQIKNDQFKIAFLSIKMPKGKEYTYRNTDAVNYNLAEYNFDPIELNLNNASPEQSNISKTKVQVGKSKVDTDIPTTKVSNPNTFAIIIANEDYKHAASVPFAKNDGAVFQQYCQKTLGVPVNNIHYVENASFNDMRIQLSWLKDVCEAFNGQASVILYFTGHGFPDQATDANYLLPTDGDSRYVTSAYKIDDLYRNLGALNAQSVTVFLDACFSGTTRDDKTMLTQGTHSVAYKVNMSQPQGKTVVFAAAQEKETAYPDNEQQHGMFTYYLLKKLQETKGDVTLRDLGTYVTTNVRQQSIVKNGKTQTPTVTASHTLGSDWQNWKLK